MKKTMAFITALLITASYGNAVFAAENDSSAETEVSQTEAVSEEKSEVSEEQNGGSDETGNSSEETVQTEPAEQPGESTESTEESEPENNDESVNDENTDEGEVETPPSEEEKFTEEEFIKRIYRIALEREADEGGLATWKGHLDSERMTAADVVRCIVSSNEYNKKEKTDEEFVQMIWTLMTDSEYNDEAAAQMTGRLAAGYSRAEIQRVLESSSDFMELCSRYGIERSGRYVHDDLKKFAGFLTEGEYEQEMLVWTLQDKNITAAELLEDYFTKKTYSSDEEGIREYVSDMYTTVLVRDEVPESGLEHWSRYLRYGMSSRFILRGFVMSDEFRNKCSLWGINSGVITVNENRDMNAGVTEFVQRIYNICLGRRADVNGLNTWTGHINSGKMTASDVVKSIVFSSEYKSHNSSDEEYVRMLFSLLRNTEANDTEVSEFVSETLGKGHTRESVLRKFGLSEEFTRMCADFGIERGEIKVGGWSRNDRGFKCYISPETGLMLTGNQMIGGIHCFFDNEGSLRTDWSDLKTFVDASNALYSYNSMVEDITGLQQQYPSLVNISVIGATADGRQIYDMMIGSPDAGRQIVIQAGCHAREYMTSQVLMANAERFLKNYWSGSYDGNSYNNLLDSYCIHIIPMLNPDGITLSQYGINGIKNPSIQARIRNIYNQDLREGVTSRSFESYLRSWKCNALGVDLNRNFDSDWAGQNEIKRPSCSGYAGTSAASENEVKALTGLVESLNDVQAVVSYHSSGSCVYWAYYQSGEFRSVCNKMASDLGSLTGYYLINSDDRGGGCSNWVSGKGLRAATLEIGSGDSPLPLSQLSGICERHRNVIPYLLSMPLYNAKEIQQNNASEYVRHLYNTILGREPDENGWKFWIARINNGKSTPADEIRLFTESTEFLNHEYSDEEFIRIAYEAFCSRQPSDEEVSHSLSMLGEGYTRSWILSRLADSDEFKFMCESFGISGGEVMLNGWQKEPDGTFYYQSGKKVCSELKNIDGNTYYFDSQGYFGNGWYNIGGKNFYVADGLVFPSNGTDWGTEFKNANVRRDSGSAVRMDIPVDFQFLYNKVICTIGGEKKTVNSSGCGAASASMVIRYLTGKTQYDPEMLFEWAYRNNQYFGYGLEESTVSEFLGLAGLKSYWTEPSAEKVTDALKNGIPVIALVRKGYFTSGGHYIVLTGVTDDGYVTVNDPNNSSLCRFEYRLDSLLKQAKCFMICAEEK